MPTALSDDFSLDREVFSTLSQLTDRSERLIRRLARAETSHTGLLMLAAVISCNQQLLEIQASSAEPDPEGLALQKVVLENFSRLTSACSAYLDERTESAEDTADAAEDWRTLRETFRDLLGQSQRVSEDDFLWDTGSAFGLSRIAGDLTTTRGAIVIKSGIVHKKGPPAFHCPICGNELRSADTTLRFIHAPADSAEQSVPGFICECGEFWPDPRAVRSAHAAAFTG